MNLNNLFGDCEDLSTTRGGGLSVLNLGAEVAARLGVAKSDTVSGASQGVFRISGDGALRTRIAKAISAGPLSKHATVYFALREDKGPDHFRATMAELRSDVRWQQMEACSVVYPDLEGPDVCSIDLVRPGKERPDDHDEVRVQSNFSYDRRQFGKERRKVLIREILSRDPNGSDSARTLENVEVVSHLQELASGGEEFGNASDKIAILRFDGNGFGALYGACSTFDELREFSKKVKQQQEGFFRALLRSGSSPVGEEWMRSGKLRLEIIVYGGDEVMFIVPAWLGWRALRTFYEHAKSWPGVSYSGSAVFCSYKTPIHSAKRLASDLVDEAKERGNRGNFAMYQVLESFDAIGRELEPFLEERWGFTGGSGVCLSLEAIASIEEAMPELHGSVSRRKLHDLVFDLIQGAKPDPAHAIRSLVERKNAAPKATSAFLQGLHLLLGNAAFLHIHELWDYAGAPA